MKKTNGKGVAIRRFAIGAAAAVIAGAGLAGNASAATVMYTDDFGNPANSLLNTAPAGWSVSNGTVDWVKDGDYGLNCNGADGGGCVDLDGSTNDAGLISNGTFFLQQGTTYILSAWVSGNQLGDAYPSRGPDTLRFGFLDGSTELAATSVTGIAASSPFTFVEFAFTPSETIAAASIFFEALGGDAVGPILDDVSLTAVPLPAAAWLLLSGLAGMVAVGRRRTKPTIATA